MNLQHPIYTSYDSEPPAPTCSIRIVAVAQFRVAHQSRTDCRTEQLSDNLGRVTKLLGPGKQSEEEEERKRERRARECEQKEKEDRKLRNEYG